MTWRDFLDERPLEPSDVARIRTLVEGLLGGGPVLVQAVGEEGAPFVGALRVVDLDVGRDDRDARAAQVTRTLRDAGYDAHVRGRTPWPDVEVTSLRPAEWRRRRTGT